MPKVSIILPTYNGEKYIQQSIDSVIDQTFMDWELIIVDDCSTDSTPKIVKAYADKDNRISVIHNDVNKRLPSSLNIGFVSAKGDYLTWTSDDNYYLPRAIEEMVYYLDNHVEKPMVVANMDVVDENGKLLYTLDNYDEQRMYLCNCVGACFMYRRYILNEVGEYDPAMFLVEDYDYWLRILFRCGSIGHITKTLYMYRMHSQSLTGKRLNDVKKQLNKLRWKYIDKLISNIKADKESLSQLYYELYEDDISDNKLNNVFKNYLPLIYMDSGKDNGKEIIVYGAGTIGEEAYQLFGDRIKYYIDRDEHKIGKQKNGKEIIPLKTLKELQEYEIVIAVSDKYIYQILEDISQYCFAGCCSLSKLKKNWVKENDNEV